MKNILTTSLGLLGLLLLCGIGTLSAATLTVSTTADSGVGSLRQALIDANFNAAANDIVFAIPTSDPGYDPDTERFTITLISGELLPIPVSATTITNTQLEGITISGNNTYRVFTLVNSAAVVITNVTIANGFSLDSGRPQPKKAGPLHGDSALLGGVPVGFGGGIYMGNSAVLTLNNCAILNNSVTYYGGGIYVSDSGTLNLNSSTLRSNQASFGAGIFSNDSGTISINASTINSNQALNYGGAMFSNSAVTVNMQRSTVDGNTAGTNAGAIYNFGTLNLTDNTITRNSAFFAGGGIVNQGTATLTNNLIAENTVDPLNGSGSDLFGTYTGTYNLIGNADGSSGVDLAPNIAGTTASPVLPLLGPLQNNGGPTMTRALLFNSPAIDKGNSPTLTVDQRGFARIFDNPLIDNDTGNGADIGAIELQSAPTVANVSISGRVLTSDGRGISKAYVYLTDTDGSPRIALTNPFGYYQISNVRAGSSYVVVVKHKLYQFQPRVVNVLDDVTELSWTPID